MARFVGVPEEIRQQLVEAMKRQTAVAKFALHPENLFDLEGRVTVAEVVSGAHHFLLERNADQQLAFFHSSPGTGTRVARVDIADLVGAAGIELRLEWSPEHTRLGVREDVAHAQIRLGEGVASTRRYRVDSKGGVVQIGDDNMTVHEFNIFIDGKPALSPTAIEAWQATRDAIGLLLRSTVKGESGYPRVRDNLALVAMVTGLEAYAKVRFLEIEGEGRRPDFQRLARDFLSRAERDRDEAAAVVSDARRAGKTPTATFVESGRINFQNFNRLKKAYSSAYGLKVGQMDGVDSSCLERVRRTIRYRHRIVHVSPREVILNQPDVPPETPESTGPDLSRESLEQMSRFISALHDATLQLAPR